MNTPRPATPHAQPFCWICGHVVDLKTCKTDESGFAVHEDCYASRITLKGAFKPQSVDPLKSSK